MSLVHPFFLWTLVFLAIPVIVHLFNLRRYKKEYFSNTSILKTILNETQKTSKLKKRLLLASRLLALLFVVLAFAQPFFDKNRNGGTAGTPIVSIYIDNSFSMEAPSGNLKAIDEAKQKALEIVQATQNQALYQIISNDFKGNQLQLTSYQEAVDIIKSIEVSHQYRTSEDVWQKQLKTTASNTSDRKIFYWLSDFQRNQFKPISEAKFQLNCVPIIHSKLNNIFLDTAFIHSPVIKLNQEVKVIYRALKSKNDVSPSALVTLTQNDMVKARKEIFWGDKSSLTDTFSIKVVSSDWQYLKLSISDPSIRFDNDFYFTFYIPQKPFVTLIGTSADQKFIVNALKADENYDVHSFTNFTIPADELKNTNLIILNQLPSLTEATVLNQWLKSNKNIALFLPPNLSIGNYNPALESIGAQPISQFNTNLVRIKQFNLQDVLLKDIFAQIDKLSDLPTFNSYYALGGYSNRAKEVLISLDNGFPFLNKYSRMGEGNLYLFLAPVQSSQSNFVYSSIFAPLMYKLGAMATSFQVNSYFIAPQSMITIPVESSSQENIYKIIGKEINVIPPQRKIGNTLTCSVHESIRESGFYSLEDPQGAKKHHIALNHLRTESQMDFLDESEIKNALNYPLLEVDKINSKYLQNIQSFSGINLWKLWVVLALLFLVIEMLLVLFWDKWATKLNLNK